MANPNSLANSNIPFFVSNQILRADDLNNLVKAINQQLRQFRVSTTGYGIINGLEISCQADSINISRGLGISGDGYVFDMPSISLTYYKRIALSKNAFGCEPDARAKCFDKEEQFDEPIYQLEQESALITTEGWSIINDLSLFEGYCLVLLICERREDRKSCFNECEAKGQDRSEEILKVLVPSKFFLEQFDDDEGGGVIEGTITLTEEVKIQRLGYQGGDFPGINLCDINSFEKLYSAYLNVCVKAINEIKQVLDDAYSQFYQKIDSSATNEQSPFIDNESNVLIGLIGAEGKYLETASGNCSDIQYLYAYLRDIMLAYNEFRREAHGKSFFISSEEESTSTEDQTKQCVYPGYVTLGGVYPEDQKRECRTPFVPAKLSTEAQSILKLAECLYLRLVDMVSGKNVLLPTLNSLQRPELRITPGARRFSYLNRRALPFYYNSSMKNRWDCSGEKIPVNHYQDYKNAGETKERNPLLCEFEEFDFYRIEGHLGKTRTDVLQKIEECRKQLNIPFDVRFVRLGPYLGDWEDNKDFKLGELDELYQNTRADILSELEEVERQIPEIANSNSVIGVRSFLSSYHNLNQIYLTNINDLIDKQENDDDIDIDALINNCENAIETFDKLKLILEANYNEAVDNINDNDIVSLPPDLAKIIKDLVCKYFVLRIQIQQQDSFPCFAKKHTGLEHLGGVYRGGTFVLVYTHKILEGELAYFQVELNKEPEEFEQMTDDQILTETIALIKSEGKEELTLESIRNKVRKVVTADFCLPYLCCSDTPIIRNEIKTIKPDIKGDVVHCRDEITSALPVYSFNPLDGSLKVYKDESDDLIVSIDKVEGNWQLDIASLTDEDFNNYRANLKLEYTLGGETEVKIVTIYDLPEIADFKALVQQPCYGLDTNEHLLHEGYKYRFFVPVDPMADPVDAQDNMLPLELENLSKFTIKLSNEAEGDNILKIYEENPEAEELTTDAEGRFLSFTRCVPFNISEGKVVNTPIVVEVCVENILCKEKLLLEINPCNDEGIEMGWRTIDHDTGQETVAESIENMTPINVNYPVENDPGFIELIPVPAGAKIEVSYDGGTVNAVFEVNNIEGANNIDPAKYRYFLFYDIEAARAYKRDNTLPAGHPFVNLNLDEIDIDDLASIMNDPEIGINQFKVSYAPHACDPDQVFAFDLTFQSPPLKVEVVASPEAVTATPQSGTTKSVDTKTPSVASSAEIRKKMKKRLDSYREELVKVKSDVGNSKGFRLANLFVTIQGEVSKLTEDYQEAVKSIVNAHKRANAKKKEAYMEALQIVTLSFMDKMVIATDNEIHEDAAKALKGAAGIMKKAGLNLTTVRKRWKSASLKKMLNKDKVTQLFNLLKSS